MAGNVACSFPNCQNPVIGQCTGYKKKEDCRKFYCADHSSGNLCYSCTSKKLAEENEALTKQEFLKIIGEIKADARPIAWKLFWERNEAKWGIVVILILGLLGLIIGIDNNAGTSFLALGIFGATIGVLLLFSEIGKQENILATNVDQQKSGFLNFFTAWKIEQQKKTWSTIGSIVLFVFVIMLAALGSETKKKRR